MIIIFSICFVLFVITAATHIIDYDECGAILFITLILGLTIFVIGDIDAYNEKLGYYYKTNKAEIASLSAANELSASFFLGTGNIENKPYYYFYRREGGRLILDSICAHTTFIIETNILPHIEYREYKERITFWNLIQTKSYTNILFVPDNTIIKEYHGYN